MPTPYSPGLKRLIVNTVQKHLFAANLIGLNEYNGTLGIRDGEDFFISQSYRIPSKDRMDAYVSALGLSPEEMEGYTNSRLNQFLYRSSAIDRSADEVPEQTMKTLIAMHLAFGEQFWNRSRFPNRYGKQYVEFAVEDDYYLKWTVNAAGELTPFGLSVALLRSKGWFEAMLVVSHENRGGVRISELAFAAARDADCFKNMTISYNQQRIMGNTYSKNIEAIRAYVNEDSAVAWVVLWDGIKPPENAYGSKSEKDSYLGNEAQFVATIKAIGHGASFDEVKPYTTTSIRYDAETIINAVRSGIDPQLIESMADGSGEAA